MRTILCVALPWALVVLPGCGGPKEGFQPVDKDHVVFWDRQVTESAEFLKQLVDDFNAAHKDMPPIKVERAGGYDEIFRKVTASIRAHVIPAMAVSYENMTAQYIPTGAVVQLDPLLNDPDRGFSKEELDDFFPAVLDTNRYADFGGKMYSFPYTKSVLMMYFNKAVLAQAGYSAPPATWDEFLGQCRAVKSKLGKFAYAVNPDCSTLDGMIFSLGGEVIRDGLPLYDQPEAIRAFEIYETLAKEKLAYQIAGGYDDQIAFGKNEVAFIFRTSSGRPHVSMLMYDRMDQWGMARIPQADPGHPATVLFGGNICIFTTSPEQIRSAWAFIKYFTAPDVMVRWALGTGYLPFRKSAAEHPDMKKFWGEWDYNRAAFDCLPFAKAEPNLAGWQRVREFAAAALRKVLEGSRTGRAAALELQQQALDLLKK